MIVGEELQLWLGDGCAQGRTERAIRSFGAAWDSGPVHRAIGGATACLENPEPEDIAAIVADLFADDFWVEP